MLSVIILTTSACLDDIYPHTGALVLAQFVTDGVPNAFGNRNNAGSEPTY